MNIYVRTRTNSGKQLTDFEILEQVPVKNLDTGENMPLSEVRSPPVPEGWNPLSLHILKLTSHLEVMQKESDEESVIGIPPSIEGQQPDEEELETEDSSRLKRKTDPCTSQLQWPSQWPPRRNAVTPVTPGMAWAKIFDRSIALLSYREYSTDAVCHQGFH